MLVDANILLYSVDEASPFHIAARDWLTAACASGWSATPRSLRCASSMGWPP